MKKTRIILLTALALILLAVGAVAAAEVTGYFPGTMWGMHSRGHMSTNHSSMWKSRHMATMPGGAHQHMNALQQHQAGMSDAVGPSQMHATTCITTQVR